MILSGKEIHRHLVAGYIFRDNTWEKSALKEASYALRIAPDGLMIDDKQYGPGEDYPGDYIEIEPGKIAILSTVERLNMPDCLAGKIGIRLDYALQGITGLMGIQVDPLYGSRDKDERLFVRVANLGNESVKLSPYDQVFTFEVHTVRGAVDSTLTTTKQSTWLRLKQRLSNQRHSSWSNLTQVQEDLIAESDAIRDHLQPLVMFGVFLVAVTILGVVVTVVLSVRDTPEVKVPSWITDWGWILLMATTSVAAFGTACVAFAAVFRLLRPGRARRQGSRSTVRRRRRWHHIGDWLA